MRISDWSSDVCSSDLVPAGLPDPETYGNCESESAPHPLIVTARKGGDMSFVLSEWGEGIRPYDFDLPYGYGDTEQVFHTMFDRALVRQGEPIHMRSDERRVGKEGVSTWRSRWTP